MGGMSIEAEGPLDVSTPYPSQAPKVTLYLAPALVPLTHFLGQRARTKDRIRWLTPVN